MQRRNLMKTLGGLAATGATAGLGISAMSGGVAAATSQLNISDPSAVTTDDGSIKWVAVQAYLRTEWDGFDEDIHYVRYIDKVTIRPNSDNNTYTINDTISDDLGDGESAGSDTDDSWGGDTGWHGGEHFSPSGKEGYIHVDIDWGICQENRDNLYNNGYMLPENPAPVDNLEADTDGATKDSTVRFTKVVRLYGSGTDNNGDPNNPLTGPNSSYGVSDPTASVDLAVSVTNQEGTATTADSGGSSSIGT
jgi:hypothetical protein